MNKHKFRVWNKRTKSFVTSREFAITSSGELFEIKHGLTPASYDTYEVRWCDNSNLMAENAKMKEVIEKIAKDITEDRIWLNTK